jgi:hypothetical protein
MDREQKDGSGLSIVLLNRGAKPFRTELFSELCKLGVRGGDFHRIGSPVLMMWTYWPRDMSASVL